MADFVAEGDEEHCKPAAGAGAVPDAAPVPEPEAAAALVLVDASSPLSVAYCPHCSMPPEYCQYGPHFKDKCLPHMQNTMTEEALARALGQVSLAGGIPEVGGGKKSRIVSKEAAVMETKVVIARVQRQKKKFVTSVLGLDTVPVLKGKLEDAAKFFKKKFSCGASVGETPSGALEVIIQGDVSLELPERIIAEYKIAPKTIFFLEGKDSLKCYA